MLVIETWILPVRQARFMLLGSFFVNFSGGCKRKYEPDNLLSSSILSWHKSCLCCNKRDTIVEKERKKSRYVRAYFTVCTLSLCLGEPKCGNVSFSEQFMFAGYCEITDPDQSKIFQLPQLVDLLMHVNHKPKNQPAKTCYGSLNWSSGTWKLLH